MKKIQIIKKNGCSEVKLGGKINRTLTDIDKEYINIIKRNFVIEFGKSLPNNITQIIINLDNKTVEFEMDYFCTCICFGQKEFGKTVECVKEYVDYILADSYKL